MTRRLTALALALVLALSLTGCWEAEPEPDDFWGDELPPEEQETSQREPAQISDFTLPYLSGQTFDPVTCIDGVQQTVGALLYEPLFTLDNSFAPQPVLCEHSSCDAQALTWTFALRSAVFSDGTALTANDVLAAYRRAAESARYGARFANVASMKAQDAHTLIVTLTQANGSFPALLDIPIVKAGTENDLVPLGTGPYVYTTAADGAALTANPHWQGSSLPLERIALAAVKDNDTALSRFASRSVHFLCLDPTGTGARTVGGAVESTDVPTAAMQYLGFNLSRTPLNDAAVRRAMSGVIDRGTLVSSLLSGHGTAAQLPIAPQDADYPKTYEYRTTAEEYAAALETAGVTAARPRSLTLLVNEENAFKRAVAESLCAQLTTAALTVTVRELPWGEYAAALEAGRLRPLPRRGAPDRRLGRGRTARRRRRAELRRLCERAALRPERRLPARRERLRRAVCQGLCRGNALCAAALQVQNGAHAIRSRGRHDPNGFRSVLRLRGLALPPLRLGELSASPNNKKAFRDLLSVAKRFFNIQGRFPAQYWRTTATTLPSTSHSRPSMGW